MADPLDVPPFSNSTMGYGWMAAWCDVCVKDAPARAGDEGNGCPHILTAMLGQTPAEWIKGSDPTSIVNQYHCTDFKRDPEEK